MSRSTKIILGFVRIQPPGTVHPDAAACGRKKPLRARLPATDAARRGYSGRATACKSCITPAKLMDNDVHKLMDKLRLGQGVHNAAALCTPCAPYPRACTHRYPQLCKMGVIHNLHTATTLYGILRRASRLGN